MYTGRGYFPSATGGIKNYDDFWGNVNDLYALQNKLIHFAFLNPDDKCSKFDEKFTTSSAILNSFEITTVKKVDRVLVASVNRLKH